ncbi:MFS transporter [Actinoplanes sp. TRM 88003]|uniref:MFS transporter n=1 Tax=Paractinoplanes aksuensis TaxID=2939490 RepID=A0ABT1DSI9_9ACTN|nr:MFS transporter [Actinoplanes aksuensis]MCO8272696.1 MFS transporter [Actinoplanes aksuensis]
MSGVTALPRPASGVAKLHPQAALAVLATAQFLIVFNGTSANLALPDAIADLGLSEGLAVWVVSGYLLTFGGLLLLAGRLGDIAGRRRLLLAALVIFGLGATVAGLAPNGTVLVVARVVQGIGAAGVGPSVLGLLMAVFTDPQERRRALGVWGAVASGGAALGVLGGGALTTWFDWRAVLLINAPFVAVLVVGIPATVNPVPRVKGTHASVTGAVLSVAGIGSLVAGLTVGGEIGWTSATTLFLFAAGIVVLAMFGLLERVSAHPFLPVDLLTRASSAGGLTAMLAAAVAMFPVMFIASVLLQSRLGFSPVAAGLMMLPISLATIGGSLLAPRMIPRLGPVRPLLVGLVVVAVGTGAFAIAVAYGVPLGAFVPATIVFGAGMGLSITGAITLALSGATPAEAGAASGLLQTGQQLGGAVGLAAITTISAGAGYAVGLGIAAAVVVAGILLVALRLHRP